MAQDSAIAPILRTAMWWLADDKFTWVDWSFADAVNLDIRSCIREISISQRPTLLPWLTSQCTAMIYTSNNKLVVFCSDWKIWLANSQFTALTAVMTATPWTKIISACEFNDYLYWTTSGKLHRIKLTDISSDWTWWESINWESLETSNYYPMVASMWDMYVWHGWNIGKVDISNVWNDMIIMDSNWVIKHLLDLWGNIRVITAPMAWRSTMYLWDWVWDSPQQTVPLNWVDVLQTIIYNWYHYIVTSDGMGIMDWYRIYWLNEVKDFSANMGAIAVINKYLLIGSKNEYIYQYWAKTKNYTEVLNKEYVITAAQGATGHFEIDNIITVGKKIFFSWHTDGTTPSYWVNLLDTELKSEATCWDYWYLITRAYYADTMYSVKETLRALIWFQALRAGEQIKIYYSIDWWEFELLQTYTQSTEIFDNFTDDIIINSQDFQYIQFKIELYKGETDWVSTSPRFNMLDLVFNNSIRR